MLSSHVSWQAQATCGSIRARYRYSNECRKREVEEVSKELRSLLVSAEAVAEDTLVDALAGAVSIIEGTGEVMALPGLSKKDLPSQVITYLLALRAAVILKQRQSAEATAPEIATALHLDVQRVRETLSRLKTSVVAKTDNGYQVPFIRTQPACELSARMKARMVLA
jgi:hypothetical protein